MEQPGGEDAGQWAMIEVPIRIPGERKGYSLRELRPLSTKNAETLRRTSRRHWKKRGRRLLPGGRLVKSSDDALEWILKRIRCGQAREINAERNEHGKAWDGEGEIIIRRRGSGREEKESSMMLRPIVGRQVMCRGAGIERTKETTDRGRCIEVQFGMGMT